MGASDTDDDGRPSVFLSHAGEDNDRFARDLAKRLADSGAKVWFDEWELLPGDSLVDRIFNLGVGHADVMVIVLSKYSIEKPWVREEINAGFVRRIEGNCKLIPVVLDDVTVPEALKSTYWITISDMGSYEAEFDRIVRGIFDDRNRPESGPRPGYAETQAIDGLYSTDTLLLRAAGDMVVDTNGGLVQSPELLARLQPAGVTTEAFLESLGVLEEHGLARVFRTLGSGIEGASAFDLTVLGFDRYVQEFVPGYDEMVTKVVVELVNEGKEDDSSIAEATGVPRVIVEHIFEVLESKGLLRITKMMGPHSFVHNVSPRLKRLLQDGGAE